MIKSMTGYGAAKGEAAGLSLGVELKSVNNRYLDVSVKLPRALMFAEEPMRAAVAKHISRGKVDVFVTADAAASDSVEVRVNGTSSRRGCLRYSSGRSLAMTPCASAKARSSATMCSGGWTR